MASQPLFDVKDVVRLHGLANEALNGVRGVVLSYDATSERYAVQTSTGGVRVLTKHLCFDVKAPDDLLNFTLENDRGRTRAAHATLHLAQKMEGKMKAAKTPLERDRLGAVITQLLERSQELHGTVDAPSVTEEAQELADIKRYLANLCAVAYAQIEARGGAVLETAHWLLGAGSRDGTTWIREAIVVGMDAELAAHVQDTLDMIVSEDPYALLSAFGTELVRRADEAYRASERTAADRERMRGAFAFATLAHTCARNDQLKEELKTL
tara:strand:+ start:1584 stop:2387 length:804 start_codon:yes stop_codon:yes gene_type:complete